MRKFKMGLITLAASAAVIVPAGNAIATSGSHSTAASGSLVEIKNVDTNVVLWTGDILSPEFGNICVLDGNQVIAVLSGTDVVCGNDHSKKAHRKG
jgi:hypothetical protein